MTTYGHVDPGPFAGQSLVFVNRCRLHGVEVTEQNGSWTLAGDVEMAAQALNLPLEELSAERADIAKNSVPRIAIYAGAAIGYPYWAYYAHALLSIGLGFVALEADQIASGALDNFDLLVMPGGFATWGLDRAEGIDGVDSAIQQFIANGGRYIGSCGGAFYMSEGRPGWQNAIDATPKFTQEYLLTGTAMLSISIEHPVLAKGLGELVEMPYYHGPIYSNAERRAETAGRFENYISPNGLFIDNPLSLDLFNQEMKRTPAIFMAAMGEGKILTYSPHPEMGEFVRKGIALDGYVRHYLPIRGFGVMDKTLRFYMKEDCAGFRLIHNSIVALDLFERDGGWSYNQVAISAALSQALQVAEQTVSSQFAALEALVEFEDSDLQEMMAAEFARLKAEWSDVIFQLKGAQLMDATLQQALVSSLEAAAKAPAPGKLAELHVMTEMPIRICAAAARIAACDQALSEQQ